MATRSLATALPVLALSLGAGCDRPQRSMPDVAVVISGERVPYDHFASHLGAQLGEDQGDLDDIALSSLFDQYLDGQLLTRLAVERGLVDGPVDERRAVAFLLRDARFEPAPPQLRAYFEAHRGEFEHPEQVRLRLILVPERELAEQALAALEVEDFAVVAARFSQGPTAHLGGDQGWLSRDDLSGLFGEVIFDLEIGEVSRVVKADFGYQIFQVTDRQEATVMPFEQAEPRIRRALQARFLDEQLASLLDEARGRYNVRVLGDNLPFLYRGAYAGGPAA